MLWLQQRLEKPEKGISWDIDLAFDAKRGWLATDRSCIDRANGTVYDETGIQSPSQLQQTWRARPFRQATLFTGFPSRN